MQAPTLETKLTVIHHNKEYPYPTDVIFGRFSNTLYGQILDNYMVKTKEEDDVVIVCKSDKLYKFIKHRYPDVEALLRSNKQHKLIIVPNMDDFKVLKHIFKYDKYGIMTKTLNHDGYVIGICHTPYAVGNTTMPTLARARKYIADNQHVYGVGFSNHHNQLVYNTYYSDMSTNFGTTLKSIIAPYKDKTISKEDISKLISDISSIVLANDSESKMEDNSNIIIDRLILEHITQRDWQELTECCSDGKCVVLIDAYKIIEDYVGDDIYLADYADIIDLDKRNKHVTTIVCSDIVEALVLSYKIKQTDIKYIVVSSN